MKIRRVRRGFTTNSSASTEWVPPPSQSNAPNAVGQTTVAPGATPGNVAAPGGGNLASNSLAIGGVLVGLASLFLLERVVKRIRARRRSDAENDAYTEDDAND